MYGGNFIFPLFSFPNFLWWSYVTFIKMPFHKIKCRLVSLKVFMLEVAMGPSTVFFGRFDQIIRAITRTSPYCGQRLLLTQSRKKKNPFFTLWCHKWAKPKQLSSLLHSTGAPMNVICFLICICPEPFAGLAEGCWVSHPTLLCICTSSIYYRLSPSPASSREQLWSPQLEKTLHSELPEHFLGPHKSPSHYVVFTSTFISLSKLWAQWGQGHRMTLLILVLPLQGLQGQE